MRSRPPGRGGRAGGPPACSAYAWADSGLLELTGRPGVAPVVPAIPLPERLAAVVTGLAGHGARWGPHDLRVALSGRAATTGWTRAGSTSVNGTCRLLVAADGWMAVNLSRPDDRAAVAALAGHRVAGDPWVALAGAVATDPAGVLERAALLGVPAARLPVGPPPDRRAGPPWTAGERIAPPAPAGGGARRPVVVDLSSLWAGPLCARILASAGMEVVKVESAARPDGARSGPAAWWRWLHRGDRQVGCDLSTPHGRAELRRVLEGADVVIEGSRPRALDQLGLAARGLDLRDGCVWLSLTGYGRRDPPPGRVAFGDDAAVAGGLVAWDGGTPVFIGDAVADPISGLHGALAVLDSRAGGGGVLVDLAMRDVAAHMAAPATGTDHVVVRPAGGGRWSLSCQHGDVPVRSPEHPPPGRGTRPPRSAG